MSLFGSSLLRFLKISFFGIVVSFSSLCLKSADLIQLLDGSSLQGVFQTFNSSGGVQFKHSSIIEGLEFSSDKIEWLRLDNSLNFKAKVESKAFFSFINGDHIYGSLKNLSDDEVQIYTVSGDELNAPRKLLRSVTHLPKGYQLLYEGPMGNDSWRMTRRSRSYPSSVQSPVQPGWQFRNGIFMAEGPGILGQTFPLKDTVFLEFDISWIGFFSLYVGLFSDNADSYDYRSQSYRLTLSPASAAIQKIQPNMRLFEFGRIRFPEMQESNQVRLGLLINRIQNKITLFKDGKIVQEFSEKQTSIPTGNSIVFSSNSTGPYLKLTRLHISTWSGDQPFFVPEQSGYEQDVVFLKNSDRVEGSIASVKKDEVSVKTKFFDASIPSDRIIHYSFADVENIQKLDQSNGSIRASLFGGGSISLNLEKWKDGIVTGNSPVFGTLSFDNGLIRQIKFNESQSGSNQFDIGDGFQEVIWDDPEEGL